MAKVHFSQKFWRRKPLHRIRSLRSNLRREASSQLQYACTRQLQRFTFRCPVSQASGMETPQFKAVFLDRRFAPCQCESRSCVHALWEFLLHASSASKGDRTDQISSFWLGSGYQPYGRNFKRPRGTLRVTQQLKSALIL
jgi:hypothetical protein